MEEHVGYTLDDEPVRVVVNPDYFRGGQVALIEFGRQTMALHHLDPELIPALRRSLCPLRAVS